MSLIFHLEEYLMAYSAKFFSIFVMIFLSEDDFVTFCCFRFHYKFRVIVLGI